MENLMDNMPLQIYFNNSFNTNCLLRWNGLQSEEALRLERIIEINL